MTGSSRSSDGLDPRRRRLLFRSWHRGTREADLIMGRFADVHSSTFDVEIEAHVGSTSRRFVAVLGRSPNPRDVQVLNFYWKFDK